MMEGPEVISNKDEMRKWSRAMRCRGKTIALVPTMGYLHQGHLSLVKEAQSLADVIVVSIYVNPGQFAPTEDLSTYPSDFQGDIQKLRSVLGCRVDAVFHPYNLYDYGRNTEEGEKVGEGIWSSCVEEMGAGHESWIRVEKLERGLCGKSRPVFFRGVATVVTKLFNIVEPDVAVFGKKDYQQWRIIQRMVRDLDFGIRIVGCEIMREEDGLAMSSRNVKLSAEHREKALSISRALFEAKLLAEKGQTNCRELRDTAVQAITGAGGKVDYAEIVDQESLEAVQVVKSPIVFCIAAWFGTVRLIDNLEIFPEQTR
ncbi:Pantoate--beta-alanine ligase [Linum grandiflorum]